MTSLRGPILRRGRDTGGFALLEVLVAVTILALLASMLPSAVVAARQAGERSETWLRATLVAETLVAEQLSDPVLRVGTRNGVSGGLPWTIAAVPAGLPAPGASRLLLEIRLSVRVSQTDTLTVETVRIGAL